MEFGNIIVISLFAYLTMYFLSLFNKKTRLHIQTKNEEMKKLRNVKVKTVEEQKKFIDLKYPKMQKIPFTWKRIIVIIGYILLGGAIWYGYYNLIIIFRIHIRIWQSLIILIVVPILVNLILRKFYLQQNDLIDYLR